MSKQGLAEVYIPRSNASRREANARQPSTVCKPDDNSPKDVWSSNAARTAAPLAREIASRIIELGWVTDERLDDVASWLARRWHPRLELTPELRLRMNEELPPAVPDDNTPDERAWIDPLIAHVQRATGLTIPDRLGRIIGLGVVDAMCVMWTDHGRGKVVSCGILYARDRRGDNGGGLRAELGRHPGVEEREALKVSQLLLGTPCQDRDAYPFGGQRLGMSGALPSSVFRLPVTMRTALAWAHLVARAVDPSISNIAMRRLVSRPIQTRYRKLPGRLVRPEPEQNPAPAIDVL